MFNFAVFMCKSLTNNWESHKYKKTDICPNKNYAHFLSNYVSL